MMKRTLKIMIFVLALSFMQSIRADVAAIKNENVKNAAENFVNSMKYFTDKGVFTVLSVEKFNDNAGQRDFYVIRLQPHGFIIMTTEKKLTPVIAYSAESDFVGHFTTISMVRQDIENRKKLADEVESYRSGNSSEWDALLSDADIKGVEQTEEDSIYYFPTPEWGQGYVGGYAVFNYYTPNHWSSGCVATAMAEVLAYYSWPYGGQGSHCYYEDDAGTICGDFASTYYNWPDILESYYDTASTTVQRAAAGLLCYHCGIGVEMDYESSGSTAETADVPDAFHAYFRMSGHYKRVSDTGFWDEMKNNMLDARPAILSIKTSTGMGHAVVVDGYADINGYYHLNMGWNGDDNGFYDISGSFNAGGYTIVVGASKGLVPNPQIKPEIDMISTTSFYLHWRVSPLQKAQYYELQQASSASGPWTTLDDAVTDTFALVTVPDVGIYYYQVRARRNDIWWDWSEAQRIDLAGDKNLVFNVNMNYRDLQPGDSIILRGNIAPLSGSFNSDALQDEDGDGIYSGTFTFSAENIGDELIYRYGIAGDAGTELESINRYYTITGNDIQILDTVYFDDVTTIDDDHFPHINTLMISRNYPNPFNPQTSVKYYASGKGEVEIIVWNILGERIVSEQRTVNAGEENIFVWDAKNRAGTEVPGGIYFAEFYYNGTAVKIIKMLYLK